jgi:ATP-dependent RNA helicase RhlE
MNFSSLGLAPELLRAIKTIGYTQMTPVQEQAIPAARRGGDLLVTAQTGTGKTCAYSLPVLQQLLDNPKAAQPGQTRVLVMAPTRELAQQVAENITDLAQYTSLKITSCYGGGKVSSQANKLKAGTDILVATPGRLKEHVEMGHIDLARTEFVILDEADRMLDMGFVVDIHALLSSITRKHQTLFFSATSSPLVNNLSKQAMNHPTLIAISKRNAVADTIDHVVYPVEEEHKYKLFVELLRSQSWYQVMAFTSTREEADKLIKALKDDKVEAAVCHSEKTQGARKRALQEFKDGKLQVLVATEVAARGLDIQGLDVVINLNLPFFTEDYVHRVGRTGRAGKKGLAISLVGPQEALKLAMIEELIGSKIKRVRVKGYEVNDFPTKIVTPKMRADARIPTPKKATIKKGVTKSRSSAAKAGKPPTKAGKAAISARVGRQPRKPKPKDE